MIPLPTSAEIEANLAEQVRLRKELALQTGVKLRNLQLAERDTPAAKRSAVLEFAAHQLDQPLRDSSRGILFMVFI
ncbi:MAG: hypothetical protein FJW31_13235 [Acidobacteria bacterium]|nr:hypothetical protein [Acidobacteriota bacterium]